MIERGTQNHTNEQKRMIETYDYSSFADEVIATCIISDPWVEGEERFRLEPVVLTEEQYREFRQAIESIGRVWNEMLGMLAADEELLDCSFYLTPWQKMMWIASGGHWHGIARADGFLLADGTVRICELNADTPSGEPEAVVLNELRHRFHPDLINPNAGFEEQFIAMLRDSYRGTTGHELPSAPNVGILYPTDLPEDLSMIELYRGWFQKRGWNVLLGSPYNLSRASDGSLLMLGRPVHLVIRHYKTDWWGEREPISLDAEEYLDPDPLDEPLRAILGAELEGNAAVVNPFGGVIAQNKLAMAFCHEQIDRFSDESRAAIRAYIPPTFRLCNIDPAVVRQERERWVLKSDYGCEGDEVVIGRNTTDEIWERVIANAIPERWVAQEYFAAAENENGMIPNYGLFLIGGHAGGIFTRFSSASTDYRALTAPTFVSG